MRFVKPLDEALILDLAQGHDLLVTLEDNAIAGGAGSAVAKFLAERGVLVRCIHLGLPDRYLDHAEQSAQLADCGLDADGITARVRTETATGSASVLARGLQRWRPAEAGGASAGIAGARSRAGVRRGEPPVAARPGGGRTGA